MKSGLKYAVLVLVLAAAFFYGCSEDEPTKIVEDDTELWVNRENFNLFGATPDDTLYFNLKLSNLGEGELEWEITQSPQWAIPSVQSGAVGQDTTTVWFTTILANIEYGIYDDSIVLSTSNEQAEIPVRLNFEAPVLTINEEVFNLDRYTYSTSLHIQNTGGGELHWRITEIPSWLRANKWEGKIRPGSDQIFFWATTENLEYGYYDDNLVIESNVGSHKISCFFLYRREVEVYPGVGAALMEIGNTVSMLREQWGDPSSNGYDRPEKTVFLHWLYYSNLGVKFWFPATQPTLWNNVDMDKIEMVPPYDGLTPDEIGIGSTFKDVKQAYGEPDSFDSEENVHVYDIGIKFEIKDNLVSRMIVP